MKPIVPNENDMERIREEAAAWLLDLQSPHCRDFDRLNAWLEQSPVHRRVWEETRMMWQMLGSAPLHYERVSLPRDEAASSIDTPSVPQRPRRRFANKVVVGGIVSACLCLAAFLAVPRLLISLEADYLTSAGEVRTVTLEDGSTVQLAAASAIRTEFTAGRRRVTLLDGEAFFDVTHNAARPFIVNASEMEVEVLGTAFDVRIGEDHAEVGLARGSVRATISINGATSTKILVPGDLLGVDTDTGAISNEKLPADDIGAWRNGRLLVSNASINDVVAQIQRYHPAWIVIADTNFGKRRVTGVYDLSDPDRALRALVSAYGGRVRDLSSLFSVITRQ